ncbi:hypothetical protein SMSP2_00163 [Limihaloglobus sulfuriphilus]|uniref:PEP-CTERM protein-sorting domain-containing protein n=1 Tax=Limihaloglobus sulfuriphilus TaxID=1851148 RepID=A0A1Q2MAY7_9BACT|nr:hypothetical protein [Limihaloglobus sulfuriphilus]AQQ69829.1 hypothetical protein SMSP2_00163 [Limihaloglobus sulfuriphilus]
MKRLTLNLLFLSAARLCTCAWGFPVVIDPTIQYPFDVTQISQYLIITTNQESGNSDVSVSNFELGANKAPVPAQGAFGGPDISSQPGVPSYAADIFEGVGYNGNVAVTDPNGKFDLSNVGIYADPETGIRLAGSRSSDTIGCSNSFFNDPNMYPNTYDPLTGSGQIVNQNQADQSTKISSSNDYPGVSFNYDHSGLLVELSAARDSINNLVSTGSITRSNGEIKDQTYTFYADDGVNVVDIYTNGNDFKLQNANFVIQGSEFSKVIFRITGDKNMLIDNANILLGDGGIDYTSVMFFSEHNNYDFSNAILSGVAFWSLGEEKTTISMSNVQGCTQLIADVVELDNVRLSQCQGAGFTPIPEPATAILFTIGTVLIRKRVPLLL